MKLYISDVLPAVEKLLKQKVFRPQFHVHIFKNTEMLFLLKLSILKRNEHHQKSIATEWNGVSICL